MAQKPQKLGCQQTTVLSWQWSREGHCSDGTLTNGQIYCKWVVQDHFVSGVVTGGGWKDAFPTCPNGRFWDSSKSDDKLVNEGGGTTLCFLIILFDRETNAVLRFSWRWHSCQASLGYNSVIGCSALKYWILMRLCYVCIITNMYSTTDDINGNCRGSCR